MRKFTNKQLTPEQIKEACEELTAMGLLEQRRRPDGQLAWRVTELGMSRAVRQRMAAATRKGFTLLPGGKS
jgi:hypothetical protein